MEKPIPKDNHLLDYGQVIKFIEEKYDIKTRDYEGLFSHDKKEGHFEKYQRITGDKYPFDNELYPDSNGLSMGFSSKYTVIRNGKRVSATKEEYDADVKLIHDHYKRYGEWTKTNPEPRYLDYWHWVMDRCFAGVHNGSSGYWNIKEIIDDESTPDWVRHITQLVYDEFKENLDYEGGMYVWHYW